MLFFSTLVRLLSAIDIFKSSIKLRIQGRDYFSSFLGKILSIFVFVYLIFNLLKSNAFSKKNPAIFQNDIENTQDSWFNFTESNMIFALSIVDINAGSLYDTTIFSISASYSTYQMTPEGYSGTSEVLPLVLCSKTHAVKVAPELTHVPYSLCLPKSTFQIGGDYSELMTKSLRVKINLCQNSTENNNSCQSKENIFNYFKGLKIGYLISQNVFSADNYEKPIVQHYKTQYFALDPSIRKYHRIFLQKVSIISEDCLFTSNANRIESWKVGFTENDFDMIADEQIFQIDIGSSTTETVITRQYMKLQESLGSMGGNVKIFEATGGLLLSLIPFGGIYMFMAHHLFSFTHEHPRQRRNKQKAAQAQNHGKQSFFGIMSANSIRIGTDDELQIRKKILTKDRLEGEIADQTKDRDKCEITISKDKISPVLGDMEKLDKVKEEEVVDLEVQEVLKSWRPSCEVSPPKPKKPRSKKSRLGFRSCGTKRKPKRGSMVTSRFNFSKNFKEYCDKKKTKASVSLNPLDLLRKKENREIFYKKMIALKRANERIKESLDIISILEKFQDLEKIKCILFNKDQLSLFSLISKPEISVFDQYASPVFNIENSQILGDKKMEETTDEQFLELIVYYNRIKKKGVQDDLDGRLIRMLDEDMKTYFEL